MNARSNTPLVAIVLLGSPALWSANHLVARWAADSLAPHALTLGRWLVASVLFLAVFGPALWRARASVARELPKSLSLAVLGIWISGVSVYYGARTTSATNIGLIYSLAPVFIALLSALVYREPIRAIQIGGIALAALGVGVIVLRGDPATLRTLDLTHGDMWIVLAAVTWAIYSVRLRNLRSALDEHTRLTCVILSGVALMAPLAVLEAHWVGPPAYSVRALWSILILGVVAGFGAYLTHSWLINRIGPTRTGVVLYLIPPYNAVLAWLLLDEPVLPYHALGGAIVLTGVYLVNRRPPATGERPANAR